MYALMGFELAKLVGGMLMPLALSLTFLLVGLVLLLVARFRTLAKGLLFLGTIALLVLSIPPVSERALLNLENDYPVLHDPPQADWVVVLGGGSRDNKNLPAASRLGESSLYRLAEGVRIAKKLPHAMLVTSGGTSDEEIVSTAELAAQVATDWGMDQDRILPLTQPLNTAAEAKQMDKLVQDQDKVILVTSAFHMRRALALFQGQGIEAVPAPAGHLVDQARADRHIGHNLPQSKYLGFAERAFWEYIGLIWAGLRGEI